MNKPITIVVLFVLLISSIAFAETRAMPYSDEYLLKIVPEIFIGKILEVKTFEGYKMAFPTKALVIQSIKGNVRTSERAIIPKHPGGFVIFEEEFDIEMDEDTALSVNNVNDAVQFIDKMLAEG